ncbi:hypothetical protein AYI70_g3064 [Smittium culicis]|uniref:Uncharacterized protein n=1 Tax=Smittium culicis TaxID=133412 RepID=A0A1R1Y593_9FUNG|nr:hypothetical protein AYI70_g3064 [Smittium culicis]
MISRLSSSSAALCSSSLSASHNSEPDLPEISAGAVPAHLENVRIVDAERLRRQVHHGRLAILLAILRAAALRKQVHDARHRAERRVVAHGQTAHVANRARDPIELRNRRRHVLAHKRYPGLAQKIRRRIEYMAKRCFVNAQPRIHRYAHRHAPSSAATG